MNFINVHEAKARLSELLVRVEEDEEFTIARAGKPSLVRKFVSTMCPYVISESRSYPRF